MNPCHYRPIPDYSPLSEPINKHLRFLYREVCYLRSLQGTLDVQEFADNDAAIAGGLTPGQLYHTAGTIKIVY